jgi:hypothetical protein
LVTPKKITVEASADHPDVLDVRDAMRQVLDYFDLLTDQGMPNVVWNLTFASTNSPFTAEGSPVDLRTNFPAFGLVADHVSRVERGLRRLTRGEALESDFPAEKREIAQRFLKRNLNGIGMTRVSLGDAAGPVDIRQADARRALEVMQGAGNVVYDYLFGSFARKEVGSVEGRIVDLGTDYEEPKITLKEHRTGREIACRISKDAHDEIAGILTAGDVWQHRRVRVRGVLNFDPTGKLVRVFDGHISYIAPKETKVSDLHDSDFTGGLPAYEYLDRLREDRFG